jgi:hypothetical protein
MANWQIFAGFGPPLGLVSLLIIGFVTGGEGLDIPFGFLVAALLFSYVYGLIPALLSVAIIRQFQFRLFRPEWLWAGLTGAAVSVAFMSAIALLSEETSFIAEAAVIYAFVGLVPALVCWRLSKVLDRRRKAYGA